MTAQPQKEGARRRRWLRRVVLLAIVLAVAAMAATAALAAIDAASGYRTLRTAQRELLQDARPEDLEDRFVRARERFDDASERADSAILAPVRVLPLFGRQVRTFRSLSDAAGQVTTIAMDALEDMPTDVDSVPPKDRSDLARRLGRVAKNATRKLEAIDVGEGSWLITPLARQRENFVEELERVRSIAKRAAVLGDTLPSFLEGPRSYLVLAGNNAEMRAGQGMFLSAGVLTVKDGRFELGEMEPTSRMKLPPDAVELTGHMAALWGSLHPNREWRNLGLSPRFGKTAKLAQRMWKAQGRGDVDGVLAIDAVALKGLLKATGPVEVNGKKFSESNVVRQVLHDQYIGASVSLLGKTERREQLSDLARAAMDAFDDGGWKPVRLVRELARAAAGRHLLGWSSREGEGALWEAAGVEGALGADSLLVGVLNRGGNKLDQFLRVDVRLSIDEGTRGSQAATLRIRLANETPRREPGYVTGPHPLSDAKKSEYLGILAVNLPGRAKDASINGVDDLSPGGRDGQTVVVGASTRIARGAERTYVIRFSLPAAQRGLVVEASARVPPIRWTFGGDRWDDAIERRLTW